MTYCRKCSRILEEESRFCPYCGAPDEDQTDAGPDTEEAPNPYAQEPSPFESALNSASAGLDAIYNGETEPKPEEPVPNLAAPRLNEPVYDVSAPKPHETMTQTVYPAGRSAEKPFADNGPEGLSTVLKVLILIGCILFPPAGVASGVILMSKKDSPDRAYGRLLLIVALIFMVLGLFCCCGGLGMLAE